MRVAVLTVGADHALRVMVGATLPKKADRGSVNMWTAPVEPTADLQLLLEEGLIYHDGFIRPETAVYRATTDGMRVAGLSPREIERCAGVTLAATRWPAAVDGFTSLTRQADVLENRGNFNMDTKAPALSGEALDAATAATTAPKVTAEAMTARIVDVSYSLLGKTTTLCIITLDNGFTVIGESACVSAANFDEEIGRGYAYKDAFSKLWPFFGFLLAENLHRAAKAPYVTPEVSEGFKPFPGELLDFGHALAALKAGQTVARQGWNGRGMWLYRVPPATYKTQTDAAKFAFGDAVVYRAYYAMVTVDRDVVPWVASQTDIDATDWVLVDREQTKAA